MPDGNGCSGSDSDGLVDSGFSPEQLEVAQAAKTAALRQLVAGVAHELNNPMSFIVGNVELLRQQLARARRLAASSDVPELAVLAERIARGLALIARGAERAARVVTDLRRYAGVGERDPWPLDLHESIELTLRLLHPRWADRIMVHRDYGIIPRVWAVPSEVNQVLMNVLANACDAIPARGNIWIVTQADVTTVAVTVRDDGTGIPAPHLERVFEPFFTTKPEGVGRGLGLAISHGIVASHGGVLRVAAAEGRGTELSILLPLDLRAGRRAAPGGATR